jgi:hypothetical protein
LRLGFEFFGVFQFGLVRNEEFAGDGLAGNGGSRLGQPSPVSAVAGEVREEKKKKKRRKKPGEEACVRSEGEEEEEKKKNKGKKHA